MGYCLDVDDWHWIYLWFGLLGLEPTDNHNGRSNVKQQQHIGTHHFENPEIENGFS